MCLACPLPQLDTISGAQLTDFALEPGQLCRALLSKNIPVRQRTLSLRCQFCTNYQPKLGGGTFSDQPPMTLRGHWADEGHLPGPQGTANSLGCP